MKLSDAILLGSTVLTSKAGGQHFSETQSGCALGMAAVARGCEFGPARGPVEAQDRRTLGTEGVWGSWVMLVVERPCYCWRFRMAHKMRIKDIIAHLFDYHVMSKRDWTLEQLVIWVKTFEPEEVPIPEMPRPLTRPSIVDQYEARRQEEREWQGVRDSFEAKYPPKQRRSPGTKSLFE